MSLSVAISGTDRSSLHSYGSLRVRQQLQGRATANFTLRCLASNFRPAVGQPVVISDRGTTVFSGSIDEVKQTRPGPASKSAFECDCVDYNQVCDRHYVARAFDNISAHDLVLSLLDNELAGEPITAGTIQGTGFFIAHAQFSYRTVAEVLQWLSKMTGYAWWVDNIPALNFIELGAVGAPFSLTDTSRNWYGLEHTWARTNYRNKQYLRGGNSKTLPRTEHFAGNGQVRSFTLAFSAAKEPTLVQVNGTAKTLGKQGVDTGFDFYWSGGSKTIQQDDGATPLGATDVLTVQYTGAFPMLLLAQNDSEIAARRAVEGGTGVYEALITNRQVDDAGYGNQIVNGALRRYGRILETVIFSTESPGLAMGQLIPISNTEFDLSGDYLITTVDATEYNNQMLSYQVTAVNGI